MRPTAEKEIVAIWDTIKLLNQYAHTLSELIGGIDPATVAAICGVDDTEAQTLQRIANFIHDLSHAINRAMIGVLDLLSCKSFNPIYTTFVHDGTLPCGQTPDLLSRLDSEFSQHLLLKTKQLCVLQAS